MGSSLLRLLAIFAFCTILGVVSQTTYFKTCPNVEWIVRDTVLEGFNADRTILAGLLRMHFHDCFVEGCDSSVLLESTPTNGKDVERLAGGNENSLRGFEVIDKVKARLEAACPGVVSCADILAMAARDSSVILAGPYYIVPTGRYDGRVSNRTLANEKLPGPFSSFAELKDNFADQGLSVQDLVVLSGGHTIGRSKCKFFESRIYNFSGTGKPDPALNPTYAAELKKICSPPGVEPSPTAAFDKDSEFSFDNSFYKNLVMQNGLLTSDSVLTGPETFALVKSLAQNAAQFHRMYVQSMINMGNLAWKTRANGEIRKKCSVVNPTISTVVEVATS